MRKVINEARRIKMLHEPSKVCLHPHSSEKDCSSKQQTSVYTIITDWTACLRIMATVNSRSELPIINGSHCHARYQHSSQDEVTSHGKYHFLVGR
jgi:hypothetical protein